VGWRVDPVTFVYNFQIFYGVVKGNFSILLSMYKKKIALLAVSAMFFACGSQDIPNESPILPNYSGYINLDTASIKGQAGAVDIGTVGTFDGINFKGSLDVFEIEVGGQKYSVMDEDYYKLQLKEEDIISITASSASIIPISFSLRFYGQCPPPNNKTRCADKTIDVLNGTASLQDTIKTGHLQDGIDLSGTRKDFYIKVFNSESTKPSPYVITVKLLYRG
jgi:hypothetical protein